jgi:hypothetical protein
MNGCLVTVGVLTASRRLRRAAALVGVLAILPINSDENDLSDTERALIRLPRNNDVPPDIVAESVREVLERRMGR